MKELSRFRQFLTEGITADEITSRVRKLGKEKGIEDEYIEDYIDELDGNFEPDAYENSTDKDLLDDLKSYIDLSEGDKDHKHTYKQIDPDGTAECTKCGLRNSDPSKTGEKVVKEDDKNDYANSEEDFTDEMVVEKIKDIIKYHELDPQDLIDEIRMEFGVDAMD